jgi:hypothetical protein
METFAINQQATKLVSTVQNCVVSLRNYWSTKHLPSLWDQYKYLTSAMWGARAWTHEYARTYSQHSKPLNRTLPSKQGWTIPPVPLSCSKAFPTSKHSARRPFNSTNQRWQQHILTLLNTSSSTPSCVASQIWNWSCMRSPIVGDSHKLAQRKFVQRGWVKIVYNTRISVQNLRTQ